MTLAAFLHRPALAPAGEAGAGAASAAGSADPTPAPAPAGAEHADGRTEKALADDVARTSARVDRLEALLGDDDDELPAPQLPPAVAPPATTTEQQHRGFAAFLRELGIDL